MMCDARESPEQEMLVLYHKFKKFKPEVTWYDETPSLSFKKGNQEFRIKYIYFPRGSLSVEFYTGVDNIRFDSRIKLTEEIQIEINEFIKHGLSKSVLNYI